MNKKKPWRLAWTVSFCALTMLISACGSDEETIKQDGNAYPEGYMVKLTSNIGEWDTGVLYADNGYILLDEDIDNCSGTSFLQIMSPNEEYDCGLYLNKETCLPECLITDDATTYYHNIGDSMMVVSRLGNDNTISIDSLYFHLNPQETRTTGNKKQWTTITYVNRDDKVKKACKALDAILNAQTVTSSQIKRLKDALDDISLFYYYDNVEDIIDSLDLCRDTYGEEGDSVIYCFTQYATKKRVKKYDPVRYGITVINYRPVKVMSTSAIVQGRIFCANDKVKKLGKWGVIYSKNKNGLSLDNCDGIAYANELDFDVKLTKLEPKTTYYYKAFYKFNSKNHEDLVFSYGDPKAESYTTSDFWTYDFTTKELPDDAVDLGLSVLWANHNVGAAIETESGGLYGWADASGTNTSFEVMADDGSTWTSPLYGGSNPPTDICGNAAYDIARNKWGGKWRLPSEKEIAELIDSCKTEWVSMAGCAGMRFTSNVNGESIFLPAAEDRLGTDKRETGSTGYYWTGTLYAGSKRNAYRLTFGRNGADYGSYPRYIGHSVRPVMNKE